MSTSSQTHQRSVLPRFVIRALILSTAFSGISQGGPLAPSSPEGIVRAAISEPGAGQPFCFGRKSMDCGDGLSCLRRFVMPSPRTAKTVM